MEIAPTTYGRMTQILHWVSALLILIMWPMGFYMAQASGDVDGLYTAHVALGYLVLLLTLARIVVFVREPHPEPLAGLSPWNERLFMGIHRLMILALFILATSGIGMLALSEISLLPSGVSAADIDDVAPRDGHGLFSRLFLLLLVAHVVGVIRYQVTKGDTLGRMGVRRPG